ncbi:hypothetical protein ACI5KX_07885 [Erythrobacter sp. GH1-10]|uniref:hypothetical protein n=1 Tax=Erythrobacter sp. GH1-10 TaxID=3349334 RepID=UPI003877A7CC
MGWGSALGKAWDGATNAAKKAASAVSRSAKFAYEKLKQGAAAAKDAVVAGAKAVAGAVEYGVDQAKLGAIRAREAQAAYQTGRSQLSPCEAGSPTEACPHAVAQCAELADARNKAIMSENTYKEGDEGKKDPLLAQTGYTRLDPTEDADELRDRLGISNPNEMLEPDGSDFRARVYKKGEGDNAEYVIGYRGTQTGSDWKQNLIQGSGGQSDSYDRAKRLAAVTDAHGEANGNPVSFTGHSLGGGMASAASAHTGRPASTFNAAGLNANTVGGAYPDPPAPTNAYFTPTDPLSAMQDNRRPLLAGITAGVSYIPVVGPALASGLGAWVGGNEATGTPVLPKAYGDRRPLPFPPGRQPPDLSFDGILESHGMGLVIEGIDAQRKALGCQ